MNRDTERRGLPWWVWLLIALVAAPPTCGVGSAIAIYGVRRYIVRAKIAEAQQALATLGAGLVRCAADAQTGAAHGLPETSRPVPASLDMVRGQKYQSSPSDWGEDAFTCAGFSMATPQYFVYQWKKASPNRGVVLALADLNGDGTSELGFEQPIDCPDGVHCTLGSIVEHP